jgi:hypothetical protein
MAEGVGDDRAEVQLTEQLCDAGVTADSHTNLHGNDRLYDDIAEIEIADIADIAEVEVPVMPVMPSTHGVEFRIDRAQGIPRNGLRCSPTLLAKSASINSRISLMTSILSGWMLNSVWRV